MRKSELWAYDSVKRLDNRGARWHFVRFDPPASEDGNDPFTIYFRNDQRTEFGSIGFAGRKDFPYRSYEVFINKIMNNAPFRRSLLDADTEAVWKKNWK